MQRVLELALAHLGAALDPACLRAPIELLLGGPAIVPRPRPGGLAAACRGPVCVAASHGAAAFAAAPRADVGSPFRFLLEAFAARLLALRLGQVPSIFARAIVLGGPGFIEGDRDRLAAALDLAALAPGTAPQLAVLEFMHDAASRLALAWGDLRHG